MFVKHLDFKIRVKIEFNKLKIKSTLFGHKNIKIQTKIFYDISISKYKLKYKQKTKTHNIKIIYFFKIKELLFYKEIPNLSSYILIIFIFYLIYANISAKNFFINTRFLCFKSSNSILSCF